MDKKRRMTWTDEEARALTVKPMTAEALAKAKNLLTPEAFERLRALDARRRKRRESETGAET